MDKENKNNNPVKEMYDQRVKHTPQPDKKNKKEGD